MEFRALVCVVSFIIVIACIIVVICWETTVTTTCMPHFSLTNLSGQVIRNVDFEFEEQKNLHKHLRDGDRVLQLGGNIGTSCITAALSANLKSNVCVEPSDRVFAVMERNVADYNVRPIHGIVSEACDRKRLVNVKGDENNSNSSSHVVEGDIGEELRCHSLAALSPPGGFTVLFADCEGCLISFLDEYGDVIRTHPMRVILYERDREHELDYSSVDDFMRRNGFTLGHGFHRICKRRRGSRHLTNLGF